MAWLRWLLGLDGAPPPPPQRCAVCPSESELRYERARREAVLTMRRAGRQSDETKRAPSWEDLFSREGDE